MKEKPKTILGDAAGTKQRDGSNSPEPTRGRNRSRSPEPTRDRSRSPNSRNADTRTASTSNTNRSSSSASSMIANFALSSSFLAMIASLNRVRDEYFEERDPNVERLRDSLLSNRSMYENFPPRQESIENQLLRLARGRQISSVRQILDEHPELINKTPLLKEVCFRGDLTLAKILVEEYHEEVNRNPCKYGREYPIHEAVISANAALVAYLLSKGADINLQQDFCDETPIQTCQRYLKSYVNHKVEPKYIPIFKLLVDAGADVKQKHQLLGEGPKTLISKLEGDPEALAKLREILEKGESGLNNFSDMLKALDADPDDIDGLIYAIGALDLKAGEHRSDVRPS